MDYWFNFSISYFYLSLVHVDYVNYHVVIFMAHLHLNELSLICDMWLNKITYLLTYLQNQRINIGKVMDFYKSCLHGEHKCNNDAKYNSFHLKWFSCSCKRTTFLLFHHVFLGYWSDKRFVERKFNQTILNQIGLDYLLAKIWINNEV